MITQFAVWYVALPMLAVAALLTTARLLRGPSVPDRVVALDLLAVISIALLAAFAVGAGQPVLIDLILAVGLLAFLGTVAFAYYLEQKGHDD